MQEKKHKIKVGVVGASGYTGMELSRLLLSHPAVDYKYYFCQPDRLFSFADLGINSKIFNALPKAVSTEILENKSFDLSAELDVVFLATPNEVSLELVPLLIQQNVHIIDLSGVYRLNYSDKARILSQYSRYYRLEHSHADLLKRFHYGLLPFNKISTSNTEGKKYIANPGCYVTSILLALVPLLKEELIQNVGITIDAKSGTSGAGKKASESLLFSEVFNECLPYKISQHQHFPEIEFYINQHSRTPVDFTFTPHLLPFHRGIISSIYTKWSLPIKNLSHHEKAQRIEAAFNNYFQGYPLIRWAWVKEQKSILNMKYVVNTPLTQIGYEFDDKNLYLFSQIDNLLKGAASQAIENLNMIFNLKLETGLIPISESV